MTFPDYLSAIVPNKGPSRLALLQHWKIYKEWIGQIESKKQPLDLQLPWLTLVARNYIEKYLKGKQRENLRVFEYGSGGSSLFFLKYAAEVVSVEHSGEWFKTLSTSIERNAIKGWSGHLIKPEA